MAEVVDPMQDWVEMTHSSSGDEPPARSLRSAYEEVWKEKGWKLVPKNKKGEVA